MNGMSKSRVAISFSSGRARRTLSRRKLRGAHQSLLSLKRVLAFELYMPFRLGVWGESRDDPKPLFNG
jgi:hypothetical protein